ncbi:hypothetical protein GUJ93_ZPchr0013g37155 [Zizania palustris]|uniref:FRIGIDA-like protein n=1 Tax=Zizania palustris TaxID=103762 RepID=A0A8J6BYE6_ZIZPA|nr:hypothetical protein GUJ93_ZPchr0013g37155 [Zizania palustris]
MAERRTPSAAPTPAPVLAVVASLQNHSSALSNFTSAWRALHSEAIVLESTVASRLHGFSELDQLCSAMDGPGLRTYLAEHRDELQDRSRSLDAALLVAPDPGRLVLAAGARFGRLHALGMKPSPEAREEARAIAVD